MLTPTAELTTIDWSSTESEILLRCRCHGHVLNVVGFLDPGEEFLFLKVENSFDTWIERWKQAWRLITGRDHNQPLELVLTLDTAKEFGLALRELALRVEGSISSPSKVKK